MPVRRRNNAPGPQLPPPPPPEACPHRLAARDKSYSEQKQFLESLTFQPQTKNGSSPTLSPSENFTPVSMNGGIAYPRNSRFGDRPPPPPGNVQIVSLPHDFLPSLVEQGAPKRAIGRRNKGKSQQSVAGAPSLHGRPQVKQRPHPPYMSISDNQHSDIDVDSFYDPLPVNHEPASRRASPIGSRFARRQSSISSASSAASALSIGSTDSQYTTLQEEDHVDKRRENLIKIKTFRSPRYGMDTIVDVIPIEPGRISKTTSVLNRKKELSPKQRFKVTPVPARDDHYRMRPSATRK